MPVTKSAKKALQTSHRRRAENILHKEEYKKAVKNVRKASVTEGTDTTALLSVAQSALDKAAKSKTIHPNKASRLKSRLARKIATSVQVAAPVKKKASNSSPAKKKAPAKAAAKKTK